MQIKWHRKENSSDVSLFWNKYTYKHQYEIVPNEDEVIGFQLIEDDKKTHRILYSYETM